MAVVLSRSNVHGNNPGSSIWLGQSQEAAKPKISGLAGAPSDSLNLGNWAQPEAETRGFFSLVPSEDRHQLCYFQIHVTTGHINIKFDCIYLKELLKD